MRTFIKKLLVVTTMVMLPLMSVLADGAVTITYNLNGGQLSNGATTYQVQTNDSNAIIPDNPTKEGFIFAGWCDSEHYAKVNNQDTCSTDRVGLETITNGNASKTLVHWTMPDNPTTNTTYVAMWEQDKFQVSINDVKDDQDYYGFDLPAGGNFWVDWGDGNIEYINKAPSNYFSSVYSHTYMANGSYTVHIGGKATGYAQDGSSAVIFGKFYYTSDPVSVNENRSVHIDNYIAKISAISGSLGAIFPTLGDTTGLAPNSSALMAIQPRFTNVFVECGYNLISKIPSNLFDGVYGVPVEYMFADMFDSCYNLQGYIPPTLFINIDKQTEITNQFSSIFNNTSVATSCSWYQENGVPLSQYITGFEEYFDGHVSCAPVDSVICKAGESFSGTKCVACSGAGCLTQATTFKCNGMAANATHDECDVPVYNITYEMDDFVWAEGYEPADFYIPGVGYSFDHIPVTKPGYFFNGWYDEDNNWTYYINVSAQDSGDKTFYIRMGLLTIDCPAGQYAYGVPGMVSCAYCLDGYYCPGGSELSVENPGLYSCETGSHPACDCDDGYVYDYTASACILNPCSTGYVWDGTMCACDENNYVCVNAGEYIVHYYDYSEWADRAQCYSGNYCPGGAWLKSEVSDNAGLIPCDINTAAPDGSMSACIPCGENGYTDTTGATECSCNEGYGWSYKTNTCISATCPTGYIWDSKAGECVCDEDNYACCDVGEYAHYEPDGGKKGDKGDYYACWECEPGNYCEGGLWEISQLNGDTGMTSCGVDTFAPYRGMSACMSCPEHGHADAGADACVCDEGYGWSEADNMCLPANCPTGYVWYEKNGHCICDDDNYVCCYDGSYAYYENYDDGKGNAYTNYGCSKCDAGHYCPGGVWQKSEVEASGSVGQILCDINTAEPWGDSSTCVSCGEHGHTETTGATECICDEGYDWSFYRRQCVSTTCPIGYVWNSEEGGQCICDKDNYVCCGAGEYVEYGEKGDYYCDTCKSGYYCPGGAWVTSELNGSIGSTSCDINTVAPKSGMSACVSCGEHGHTDTAGATECICDEGYGWSYAANTCVSTTCPTGYVWASKDGECVCDKDNYVCADAGEYIVHYDLSTDWVDRAKCYSGNYCPGGAWLKSEVSDNSGMIPCGMNTVAPDDGMDACIPCGNHGRTYITGAESCICDVKYEWDGEECLCLPGVVCGSDCLTKEVTIMGAPMCLIDLENKTTPALTVKSTNGVFYLNLTEEGNAPVSISSGSEHVIRIIAGKNRTVYNVHDATVD